MHKSKWPLTPVLGKWVMKQTKFVYQVVRKISAFQRTQVKKTNFSITTQVSWKFWIRSSIDSYIYIVIILNGLDSNLFQKVILYVLTIFWHSLRYIPQQPNKERKRSVKEFCLVLVNSRSPVGSRVNSSRKLWNKAKEQLRKSQLSWHLYTIRILTFKISTPSLPLV